MEHVEADSRESMAAYGRRYAEFIFLNCLDPLVVKYMQGPALGRPQYEGLREKKEERLSKAVAAGFVFTVSTFIDFEKDENKEKINTLINASVENGLQIDFMPPVAIHAPDSNPNIGIVGLTNENDYSSLTTTRKANSTQGLPKHLPENHIAEWFGLSQDRARELCIEIFAHRILGNHIFITSDKRLIADRDYHGFLSDAGIHSIDEANEKAGVILRRSGTYPLEKVGSSSRVTSGGLIYSELAQELLPAVLSAFRSTVNPKAPANLESVHEFINAILTSYSQLLMSLDELALLHWEDQYIGGNNNLLEKQMYHFQYALILISSILESLAWIVAKYYDVRIRHVSDVSYRRLVEAKVNWIKELAETKQIIGFAKSQSVSKLFLACNELRNIIAHRGGLRFGVGSIRKILDPERNLTSEDLKFGTILVYQKEVNMNQCPRIQGVLYGESDTYILPFPFIKRVSVLLADYLNKAFSHFEWPDADWFLSSKDLIEPPLLTGKDKVNMLRFFDRGCRIEPT